jgi:exopolysaccharide biosynthesis protein
LNGFPGVRRLFLVLSLAFALSAAAQWQRVAAGVDYQHIRRGSIDVHVTRIDLGGGKVHVIATREGDRSLTVSEFAKKTGALVAVNGGYFNEQLWPIGTSIGACGTWWHGVKVQRNEGLVAFGKRRAEVQDNTQKTKRWMKAGLTGWPLLVSDCKVVEKLPGSDSFTRAPHPRTAMGLSGDGKTVYLLVADGRREGTPVQHIEAVPGFTLPELAKFMREELGVCRAMNLDGGGSSAIWVRDAIVNHPSDGFERHVGNHLAVVAASADPGCGRDGKVKE